jgi:hypothetical protein
MSDAIAICERLLVASYSLMDKGLIDACVGLFAEDGEWVRGGKPCVGRRAIREALGKRALAQITRHIVTNVMVTVDGDEAGATALMVPLRGKASLDGTTPLTAPAMVADLEARFRRIGGEWFISYLKPVSIFAG